MPPGLARPNAVLAMLEAIYRGLKARAIGCLPELGSARTVSAWKESQQTSWNGGLGRTEEWELVSVLLRSTSAPESLTSSRKHFGPAMADV